MLLAVEMPEETVLFYEWVEEGKPYREFLVPAEVVNRYSPFEVAANPCDIHDDRFDVGDD